MPVFDFNSAPAGAPKEPECTYTTYRTNAGEASAEKPILLLDNQKRRWDHHSCGVFTNPAKQTAFEFKEEDGKFNADILLIDARFVSLIKWLASIRFMCACPAPTGRTVTRYTGSVRQPSAAEPSFPRRTDFYSS